MQHNNDETLALLRSINQRLAQAYPTFEDVPRDVQEAIFLNALDNASLAEVFVLEMTDPDLVSMRKEREAREIAQNVAMAKRAGVQADDTLQKVAAQFKQIEGKLA